MLLTMSTRAASTPSSALLPSTLDNPRSNLNGSQTLSVALYRACGATKCSNSTHTSSPLSNRATSHAAMAQRVKPKIKAATTTDTAQNISLKGSTKTVTGVWSLPKRPWSRV